MFYYFNIERGQSMGNTRHCIDDNKLSCFDTIKLLYVSTSKYEGDWQSILHSHPFSELFYVVQGSGSFITEGMEFSVGKNDLVVINPNVQHTEKSLPTAPLEYIVLGIEGLSFSFEEIAATQEGVYMQTAFGDVYKYNTQNSNIFAYLNILLEEINKKAENYETVCQNLLEVIMICMLRNNNLSIVQSSNALLNRECTQIKHYLDANYAENITLDMLASLPYEQVLLGPCLHQMYRNLADYVPSAKEDTGGEIAARIHLLFDFPDIDHTRFFFTVLFFTGI